MDKEPQVVQAETKAEESLATKMYEKQNQEAAAPPEKAEEDD